MLVCLAILNLQVGKLISREGRGPHNQLVAMAGLALKLQDKVFGISLWHTVDTRVHNNWCSGWVYSQSHASLRALICKGPSMRS